jgi:hydroxymethylbilane synthase
MVGAALARANSGLRVEYHWVESEGDQRPQESLAAAGGKGLFVRAIEAALLSEQADLAVHSLKDLPAQPGGTDGDGLVIAAVPRREDVRDCLVAPPAVESLEQLKPQAVVGTASPRRAAQLLRLRADLRIQLMRGNVDTRLRKVLEDQQYDATLLAVAGLRRAGLGEHARLPLDTQVMLPAAGQGALALQCRSADHVTLTRCLPLNDATTAQAVHAERQVVAALRADCHSAIAVLVEPVNAAGHPNGADWAYRLRARVLSADGRKMAEADRRGPAKTLGGLVRQVVADLAAQGAREMLAAP